MATLKRVAAEPDSDDDGDPRYIAITTETRKRRKIELEGIVLGADRAASAQDDDIPMGVGDTTAPSKDSTMEEAVNPPGVEHRVPGREVVQAESDSDEPWLKSVVHELKAVGRPMAPRLMTRDEDGTTTQNLPSQTTASRCGEAGRLHRSITCGIAHKVNIFGILESTPPQLENPEAQGSSIGNMTDIAPDIDRRPEVAAGNDVKNLLGEAWLNAVANTADSKARRHRIVTRDKAETSEAQGSKIGNLSDKAQGKDRRREAAAAAGNASNNSFNEPWLNAITNTADRKARRRHRIVTHDKVNTSGTPEPVLSQLENSEALVPFSFVPPESVGNLSDIAQGKDRRREVAAGNVIKNSFSKAWWNIATHTADRRARRHHRIATRGTADKAELLSQMENPQVQGNIRDTSDLAQGAARGGGEAATDNVVENTINEAWLNAATDTADNRAQPRHQSKTHDATDKADTFGIPGSIFSQMEHHEVQGNTRNGNDLTQGAHHGREVAAGNITENSYDEPWLACAVDMAEHNVRCREQIPACGGMDEVHELGLRGLLLSQTQKPELHISGGASQEEEHMLDSARELRSSPAIDLPPDKTYAGLPQSPHGAVFEDVGDSEQTTKSAMESDNGQLSHRQLPANGKNQGLNLLTETEKASQSGEIGQIPVYGAPDDVDHFPRALASAMQAETDQLVGRRRPVNICNKKSPSMEIDSSEIEVIGQKPVHDVCQGTDNWTLLPALPGMEAERDRMVSRRRPVDAHNEKNFTHNKEFNGMGSSMEMDITPQPVSNGYVTAHGQSEDTDAKGVSNRLHPLESAMDVANDHVVRHSHNDISSEVKTASSILQLCPQPGSAPVLVALARTPPNQRGIVDHGDTDSSFAGPTEGPLPCSGEGSDGMNNANILPDGNARGSGSSLSSTTSNGPLPYAFEENQEMNNGDDVLDGSSNGKHSDDREKADIEDVASQLIADDDSSQRSEDRRSPSSDGEGPSEIDDIEDAALQLTAHDGSQSLEDRRSPSSDGEGPSKFEDVALQLTVHDGSQSSEDRRSPSSEGEGPSKFDDIDDVALQLTAHDGSQSSEDRRSPSSEGEGPSKFDDIDDVALQLTAHDGSQISEDRRSPPSEGEGPSKFDDLDDVALQLTAHDGSPNLEDRRSPSSNTEGPSKFNDIEDVALQLTTDDGFRSPTFDGERPSKLSPHGEEHGVLSTRSLSGPPDLRSSNQVIQFSMASLTEDSSDSSAVGPRRPNSPLLVTSSFDPFGASDPPLPPSELSRDVCEESETQAKERGRAHAGPFCDHVNAQEEHHNSTRFGHMEISPVSPLLKGPPPSSFLDVTSDDSPMTGLPPSLSRSASSPGVEDRSKQDCIQPPSCRSSMVTSSKNPAEHDELEAYPPIVPPIQSFLPQTSGQPTSREVFPAISSSKVLHGPIRHNPFVRAQARQKHSPLFPFGPNRDTIGHKNALPCNTPKQDRPSFLSRARRWLGGQMIGFSKDEAPTTTTGALTGGLVPSRRKMSIQGSTDVNVATMGVLSPAPPQAHREYSNPASLDLHFRRQDYRTTRSDKVVLEHRVLPSHPALSNHGESSELASIDARMDELARLLQEFSLELQTERPGNMSVVEERPAPGPLSSLLCPQDDESEKRPNDEVPPVNGPAVSQNSASPDSQTRRENNGSDKEHKEEATLVEDQTVHPRLVPRIHRDLPDPVQGGLDKEPEVKYQVVPPRTAPRLQGLVNPAPLPSKHWREDEGLDRLDKRSNGDKPLPQDQIVPPRTVPHIHRDSPDPEPLDAQYWRKQDGLDKEPNDDVTLVKDQIVPPRTVPHIHRDSPDPEPLDAQCWRKQDGLDKEPNDDVSLVKDQIVPPRAVPHIHCGSPDPAPLDSQNWREHDEVEKKELNDLPLVAELVAEQVAEQVAPPRPVPHIQRESPESGLFDSQFWCQDDGSDGDIEDNGRRGEESPSDEDSCHPSHKSLFALQTVRIQTQRKQKLRHHTKILNAQDAPPPGRIFRRPSINNFYIDVRTDASDGSHSTHSEDIVNDLAQEISNEPFPSYFLFGGQDNVPVQVNIFRKASTRVSFCKHDAQTAKNHDNRQPPSVGDKTDNCGVKKSRRERKIKHSRKVVTDSDSVNSSSDNPMESNSPRHSMIHLMTSEGDVPPVPRREAHPTAYRDAEEGELPRSFFKSGRGEHPPPDSETDSIHSSEGDVPPVPRRVAHPTAYRDAEEGELPRSFFKSGRGEHPPPDSETDSIHSSEGDVPPVLHRVAHPTAYRDAEEGELPRSFFKSRREHPSPDSENEDPPANAEGTRRIPSARRHRSRRRRRQESGSGETTDTEFSDSDIAAAYRAYAGSRKPLEEQHVAVMLKSFRRGMRRAAIDHDPPSNEEDDEEGEEGGENSNKSIEPTSRGLHVNLRQRRIRKMAFEWMGRVKVPIGIAPITTLERHQLQRWVRSGFKPRCGPCIDNFELCLDFEGINSEQRVQANAWNQAAARVFAEEFIELFPEYAEEKDTVVENFLAHLITLKKHYVQYMKDDPEAQTENLTDKACRQRRMNRVARRRNICKFYAKDPTMESFYLLFKTKLPWGACSGDEYEGDSDQELLITQLPWRAPRIRSWMQTLDNLDLAHRFEDGMRAGPGNFPRLRRDPKSEDPPRIVLETRRHRPVKGLPRNFYSKKWLKNLAQHDIDLLDIQPPIPLTFPPPIVRLAQTAITIRDRDTRPLQRNFED